MFYNQTGVNTSDVTKLDLFFLSLGHGQAGDTRAIPVIVGCWRCGQIMLASGYDEHSELEAMAIEIVDLPIKNGDVP